MGRPIIAGVALALSACAATVQQSNAAGGVIAMNFSMTQTAALKRADGECARYGKVAETQSVNEVRNSLRYRCVGK